MDNMALTEMSELLCLVCSSNIDVSSCINIFYASLPHNGEILANFILKVLKLSSSDLRSSYICLRCSNLFGMLEEAQQTVANIQCEIFKVFEGNTIIKPEIFLHPKNISTENISRKNIDQNQVVEKFMEHEIDQIEPLKNLKESQSSEENVNLNNAVNQNASDSRVFISAEIISRKNINQNEVVEKYMEHETDQIELLKELREDYSSEKDFNVNSTVNQNAIDSRVIADVDIKYSNESHVINKNKEPKIVNYMPIKPCLRNTKVSNESYKIETVNETSIFSDAIIKISDDVEEQKHEWKNVENSTSLKNHLNLVENQTADTASPRAPSNSPSKSLLSGHISKFSQKPLKHGCPTCGKKWRTAAALRTHQRSHLNLRPYMCEKCGQAYKHKHALEIHVGMHNGVSPYRCSHCNKCFTQKGALQRHLPLHTGETPYQCELCGKRFIHHTSYKMHALSHTGKKSHRCHVCDLSLLSTSHLKRHMRIHTGEKPYGCDLCGKTFAERYNLLAHQKTHDPIQISAREAKRNQYKCTQCEASFSKKQKFEEHMKQHLTEARHDGKWIGHTVEVDPTRMHPENYSINGADLLETCVNEVWQSLTKEGEKMKTVGSIIP